jgi:hypothetical protein
MPPSKPTSWAQFRIGRPLCISFIEFASALLLFVGPKLLDVFNLLAPLSYRLMPVTIFKI